MTALQVLSIMAFILALIACITNFSKPKKCKHIKRKCLHTDYQGYCQQYKCLSCGKVFSSDF